MIVDNEEATDVDILEITDPRSPVLLTELDLNEFDVAQPPELVESFLHDVVVERIRGTWMMVLSDWDGGWVRLDVADPANPVFVPDCDYPFPVTLLPSIPFRQGNAHQG